MCKQKTRSINASIHTHTHSLSHMRNTRCYYITRQNNDGLADSITRIINFLQLKMKKKKKKRKESEENTLNQKPRSNINMLYRNVLGCQCRHHLHHHYHLTAWIQMNQRAYNVSSRLYSFGKSTSFKHRFQEIQLLSVIIWFMSVSICKSRRQKPFIVECKTKAKHTHAHTSNRIDDMTVLLIKP